MSLTALIGAVAAQAERRSAVDHLYPSAADAQPPANHTEPGAATAQQTNTRQYSKDRRVPDDDDQETSERRERGMNSPFISRDRRDTWLERHQRESFVKKDRRDTWPGRSSRRSTFLTRDPDDTWPASRRDR